MTSGAFFSFDVGSPSLTSTPGSLIAVLDACLLTGYGSKLAVTGWQKVFSDVNKAAYRATSGNRFYLRVDDSDNNVARVVGYETMSDINTGTSPFPTGAQIAGGLFLRKTNGSAGGWAVFANSTCFYFMPSASSPSWTTITTNDAGGQFFFGEFISYRIIDNYSTMIIGATASTLGNGYFGNNNNYSIDGASFIPGHYLARNAVGLRRSTGGSKCTGKLNYNLGPFGNQRLILGEYDNVANTRVPIYPDPVTGKIPLMRVHVSEFHGSTIPNATNMALRGYLPGLWVPAVRGFLHGDTMNGGDMLAGKSFIFSHPVGRRTDDQNPANIAGMCVFETSDTW